METEELCVDNTENELTDEQLFQRCGTKLTKEKVEQILKERTFYRSPIFGTPKAGTIVNGYTIIEHLCTGGFGTVCLASKNDLFFAIKFLYVNKTQRGPDKEFKILYNLLKSKEHENFLTAYEWKQLKVNDKQTKEILKEMGKKMIYIVMKLAGPSLRMLLDKQFKKEKHPFVISRGVPIIKNSLTALQLFHEKKLVHHDIKLENFAIDITSDDRVLLLDYGLASCAPQVNKVYDDFKGTRFYASRRALDNKTQSYRDDYESWFNCLFCFLCGAPRWGYQKDALEKKKDFWSTCNVKNIQLKQIIKHINHLEFYQKMNFNFVQQCLQEILDDVKGIPRFPYLYQSINEKGKIIANGNYIFIGHEESINGKKRFVCNDLSCKFAVYIEKVEYEKAEEGTEAIIIDTLNHHTCTSTTT